MRLVLLVAGLVLIAAAGNAQAQVRLSGAVTSAETGLPLAAAHVRIQDTSTGSITNERGQFELVVPSLPVVVEIRYIGYRTEAVRVTAENFRPLDIRLRQAIVELEEIVVSGVDRAEQIMREVGRRKRALFDSLGSSVATAYSRLTLSKSGELQLLRETVWDAYYEKQRGRRNIVRSFRETSELYRAFGIVPGAEIIDFYDDVIEINGLPFVGPTHPDAEATYEFSLGSVRMVDSLKAYEIYIAPRSPIRPSFIGTLTIVDSLYTIAEAELRPARHVEFPNGFDNWNVSYRQHFAPVDGDVWFPIDLVAEGRISRTTRAQEYLSAYYQQYSRLSDFQFGVPVPEVPYASNELVQIDSASVFEDYLFMRGYNIIPLTPREEEAFYRLRSDPKRLTSVFRERPQYDFLSVVRPREYRRDGPQFVFPTIRGYIPTLRYNRVDGFLRGIGQEGTVSDRTRLWWGLGQASGSDGIRYDIGVDQRVGFRSGIGFELRRGAEPQTRSVIYSPAVTTLPSIAGRGDYFDYYWSTRTSVFATQSWDFVRLKLLAYRDRDRPLERAVGKSWPWGTTYSANPAITDSMSTGVVFSVRVGDSFEPYEADARSAVLSVEQGLDEGFTRVSGSVDFSFETLFRNSIRPNRLQLRIVGGTLLGARPLQRLGGIDGSLLGFGTLGVFRSLRDRQLRGDRWAGLFADHDFGGVLFDKLGLAVLSETRTGLRLFGSAGMVEIRPDNSHGSAAYGVGRTVRAEAGLSISNVLGSGLRLDWGSRLDRPGYFVGFGFGRR